MLKLLLVPGVSPVLVAVSVYPVPALSILQPANDATPATAASGFAVHVSAAPVVPVPLVIASVTEAVLFTVFPLASSMVTTGCVPSAAPPVPPPGCVVKTN
jgi:hypothetical protein